MESTRDGGEKENQEAVGVLASELQITQRQAEVLHWIAEGKSNNETAAILGCSVNTIKAHLKDIFQRLGLHSRSAATACAYRAHIRHARRPKELPIRVIPGKTPPL
ncbi:MAG: helix-turn-helix transcriptional regulator [Verrucomicrobiaceae bacterium]|nr:helix-turn-helix transcriptional regulator [Verrucomicrobiaceae bacterium]